jgi:hypothetical protein
LSSRGQPDDVDIPSFSVRVTAEAKPMFAWVADAIVSTAFEGSASVAALWASLPDMPRSKGVTEGQLDPLYFEPAWRLISTGELYCGP